MFGVIVNVYFQNNNNIRMMMLIIIIIVIMMMMMMVLMIIIIIIIVYFFGKLDWNFCENKELESNLLMYTCWSRVNGPYHSILWLCLSGYFFGLLKLLYTDTSLYVACTVDEDVTCFPCFRLASKELKKILVFTGVGHLHFVSLIHRTILGISLLHLPKFLQTYPMYSGAKSLILLTPCEGPLCQRQVPGFLPAAHEMRIYNGLKINEGEKMS